MSHFFIVATFFLDGVVTSIYKVDSSPFGASEVDMFFVIINVMAFRKTVRIRHRRAAVTGVIDYKPLQEFCGKVCDQ